MSGKILITGASGNIGSEVVKQLKARGVDFVAANSSGSIEGAEAVALNYGDKASLLNAMQGVETLFMLVPGNPEMVQWGENVIDAAKECGVSHVVRSSGSLANKDSDLIVEQLLGKTDEYLKNSGLDYTITAPSFFMQNFVTQFADDYKNGAIYLPSGDGKIGFVDVRDIAAVNVEVLLNPEAYKGQTLTITGPDSLSYAEAVGQMNKVLGKESQYVAVPDEAAIEAMKGMGLPTFVIDLMISLNHCVVRGHADEVTDTVANVLGRQAIDLTQFVEDNKNVWL